MQLVIKAHADEEVKTITLKVQSTDTVGSVKQKIQEAEGQLVCCRDPQIRPLASSATHSKEQTKECLAYLCVISAGYPTSQQFLVLGLRLEDGQTLADYDIQRDTVLHMRMV